MLKTLPPVKYPPGMADLMWDVANRDCPPMEQSRPPLQPGIYRHFKGGLYEVIDVAPVVDSAQWFVVYRPMYGDHALVLRNYDEFVEAVSTDGHPEPRFHFVGSSTSDLSDPCCRRRMG